MSTKQGLFGTCVDGDLGPAEFHRIESIASSLLDAYISRDSCDCDHAHFGCAEGHDERNRIIGGNIGINEQGAWHPRIITNSVRRRLAWWPDPPR